MLSIVCAILPIAFLPGLISGALAPKWAILSIAVPLMIWRVDIRLVKYKWVLLSALAYAAASIYWMEIRLDGYMELWHMALIIGAFVVGASQDDIRTPLRFMAWSVAISLPLCVLQTFGYSGIDQVVAPAGLFINKNVLGEIAAALLVAMIYGRRWRESLALFAIVVLTREKAAFVAIFVAGIVWLWPRFRITAISLSSMLIVAGFFVFGTVLAQPRIEIWLDTIQGMTLLGNGIGSFWTTYPIAATHFDLLSYRPEHAHNEILHFVFEIGIGSVFLAALAGFALRRRGTRELEYLVFVCILTEGMFAFPLHMPTTAFLAALVAGRLCRVLPDNGVCGYEGRDCRA